MISRVSRPVKKGWNWSSIVPNFSRRRPQIQFRTILKYWQRIIVLTFPCIVNQGRGRKLLQRHSVVSSDDLYSFRPFRNLQSFLWPSVFFVTFGLFHDLRPFLWPLVFLTFGFFVTFGLFRDISWYFLTLPVCRHTLIATAWGRNSYWHAWGPGPFGSQIFPLDFEILGSLE